MADYAHPEMLVDTAWVEEHGNDPGVRVVEVDVDTDGYDEGHIECAVGWNWNTQLCDRVRRDIIPKDEFETLMAAAGIANDTKVILCGDNNNWFAAWALWQLKIYGHQDVCLMNGGRKKWIAEGRPLSLEKPSPHPAAYTAKEPDFSIRAFLPDVQSASAKGSWGIVDVRTPAEYSGEMLAPPGLPVAFGHQEVWIRGYLEHLLEQSS